MGIVLSLVRRLRKKQTTNDILEGIDKDIAKAEKSQQRNRQLQQRIVLLLVLSSVVIYFGGAVILYRWFLPDSAAERILYVLPFLAFPVVVVLLRRILHFFFVTRINRIGKTLKFLKEQKKSTLESVTETEKYKVAKELLEKFDPKGEFVTRADAIPVSLKTPGQELRHRNPRGEQGQHAAVLPRVAGNTPAQPNSGQPGRQPQVSGFSTPIPGVQNCPILPRERTPFDKIAEYFIGDGPSYRYALICGRCKYHNGMALQDEFEFIDYRCCYCGYFNPSRRKRAEAPPLYDVKSDASEDDSSVMEEEPNNGDTAPDRDSATELRDDDDAVDTTNQEQPHPSEGDARVLTASDNVGNDDNGTDEMTC